MQGKKMISYFVQYSGFNKQTSNLSFLFFYSPRYIFTKLEKITRTIFHPDDDAVLTNLYDDGDQIEPEFYMPVIPMVLVNGAEGIGTGWSTNIPNYNPREIIQNLRRKIKGEEMEEMHPNYFGYQGSIVADVKKSGSYTAIGKIERIDEETLLISELPIKKWTQDYKIFLEKMMTGETKTTTKKSKKEVVKTDPEIRDFKENHTDTTVSFTISASKEQIDGFEKYEKGGLLGKFKLTKSVATTNMHLFDENNRIMKFDTANEILDYFYTARIDCYKKRKDHMLKNMRREQRMLSNKARFIEEVCSDDLVVSNRKRATILTDLKERKYDLFPKEDARNNSRNNDADSDSEDAEDSSNADLAKGYEYLLGMKIWSLTFEKAEKLRKELAEKTHAVTRLEQTPPSTLWENDLDSIEEALDDRDQFYIEAAEEEAIARQNSKKNNKGKKKAAPRKKRVTKKPSPKSIDDVVKISKSKGPVKDVIVDSDDDDFQVKKKATTKKVPVKQATNQLPIDTFVKKAPVKRAAKKVVEIDLDDSSDSEPESMSMSLMARMKKKDGKAEPAQPISRKRLSPRASESDSEELDSFDTTKYQPATLTPAPKKLKATKPKVNAKVLNLDSDDECFESKPNKTRRKPAAKPKPARKVSKKKVEEEEFDFSDEEEEFDEDILDESEDEFIPPRPAPSRNRRATKKTTYTEEFDSDDDFDFDE